MLDVDVHSPLHLIVLGLHVRDKTTLVLVFLATGWTH